MNQKLTQFIAIAGLASLTNIAIAEDIEVYSNAGAPGINVGIGYGINEKLTIRSDFMTAGRISRSFNQRGFHYEGKLKSDKLNINADYFLFDNGFRVTAGLGLGRTKIDATGHSRESGGQTVRIGGKKYSIPSLDSNDTLHANVKYPAVSPYLGIGWGHNVKQKKAGEWGFNADLGLYVGNPKTKVGVSDSLYAKLIEAEQKSGTANIEQAKINVNNRIDRESSKIKDRLEKYKVIPAISVGVSYFF